MDVTIKNLKQIIQSSHVNFLYGSGLSQKYLATLGNIEKLLTEVDQLHDINDGRKVIIKASLYAEYFNSVMKRCLPQIISKNLTEYNNTFNEYVTFLNSLNMILSRRNVNLINKQVNLFTTNIDDFTEKAAEKAKVELNDGFKGHISPMFSEDTFSNIISKSSTLYQNNSTIPVFNLLKIHGSINWKSKDDNEIIYDPSLKLIKQIDKDIKQISENCLIPINKNIDIKSMQEQASEIELNYGDSLYNNFMHHYDQLVMINPNKAKFRETVLDYHFYELMRMYSNSLERSSSVLFVAGFSFADEHIANITIRSANANPTLEIIVFAYDKKAKDDIASALTKKGICNNNIEIVSPDDYKRTVKLGMSRGDSYEITDIDKLEFFDFKSINEFVFSKLASVVE